MGTLDQRLEQLDPDVFAAIRAELARQQHTLEMIAGENFAPVAVMEAQGSALTASEPTVELLAELGRRVSNLAAKHPLCPEL